MWRIVFHVCLCVSAFTLQILVFLVNGQKVSQVAVIGEPATLQCNVKGDMSGENALMIYMILKGGSSVRLGYHRQQKFIELTSGKGVEFIRKNNIKLSTIDIKSYKLNIAKVTMELDGVGLRCVLSADGGLGDKLWEESIILNVVASKPPSISISPDEVVVGQRVNCSAEGYPQPLVGIKAFGKTAKGTFTVSLVVPKTVEGQQEVRCIAKNNVVVVAKTKTINVKNKPHSISMSPDAVVVGDRVKCSAQGYPQPEVRMEAFGKLVNGKSVVSLVVPTTMEGQQEAKCIAWNSVGTDTTTQNINVKNNCSRKASDDISMQRIRRLQIQALEMQIKSQEMQMKASSAVIATCTKINQFLGSDALRRVFNSFNPND